jgi:Fe-S cluster assembly protein SufD
MQTAHQSTLWYQDRFTEFARYLNGEAATPLHGLRRAAMARFSEIGFPTTKMEEWRFTNVTPIVRQQFVPTLYYQEGGLTSDHLRPFLLDGLRTHRLVFVNGHFSRLHSSVGELPAGVRLENLATVLRDADSPAHEYLGRQASFESNPFIALQTAFLQDGTFLLVPDETTIEDPIHLVYVASEDPAPFAAQPRTLVVVGNDCRVSIVESHVGVGVNEYFTNVVSEIVVGDRSAFEHDVLQMQSINAFHVGNTFIRLGAQSIVTSNTLHLGGALVRTDVSTVFGGEHGECTLNGLSLATGTQLIDNHTTIDHALPNCASHELYKAILDGKSRGVFNGKIYVRKDAQKTDAKQTNKTLLLSEGATIDTKPQLEIVADDVKCTHGATVGQLDENQVFYLRARGIDEVMARDILTFAFAAEVVDRIHVEPLRRQLDGILHQRLHQGRIAPVN